MRTRKGSTIYGGEEEKMTIDGFVILKKGKLGFGTNLMGEELYAYFMRTKAAAIILGGAEKGCEIVPATLTIEVLKKKK